MDETRSRAASPIRRATARGKLMFAPELGVALLENCPSKPREQQIWTLRLAETKFRSGDASPAPAAPPPSSGPRIVEDAVVSVISPTRVELDVEGAR